METKLTEKQRQRLAFLIGKLEGLHYKNEPTLRMLNEIAETIGIIEPDKNLDEEED
jgi:hypothetical protein